jgi:hypothetical protein
MQAVAAELSGYAGKIPLLFGEQSLNQFASMHPFSKRLLNRRAASV